jgi:hypothetical protein
VPVAREVLKEIQTIYRNFGQPENLVLDVHNGGHEIDLPILLNFMEKNLIENEK